MIPAGENPVERAIASAMGTAWAVGPARYRHQEHPSEVDTVLRPLTRSWGSPSVASPSVTWMTMGGKQSG